MRNRILGGLYYKQTLSVRGLPHDITEDVILDYFTKCGIVNDIRCVTCPNSGAFLGKAFITFAKQADARKSFEYDGSDIGWSLKIRRCKLKPGETPGYHYRGDLSETPRSLCACISNLSCNIDFEAITTFFLQSYRAMKIKYIRFFFDENTRDFKGFGHVRFCDVESLRAAIKLNQTPLLGQPVKIAYAMKLNDSAKFWKVISESLEKATRLEHGSRFNYAPAVAEMHT